MNKDSKTSDDLVKIIPGSISGKTVSGEYELSVVSYAGSIILDTEKNNNLYYWFFESQTATSGNQSDIPLVIWLNGGPGASSLAGLFLENGPFLLVDDSVKPDTATIKENTYGWNKQVHLMYWDQPVGTGFSHVGSGSYATSESELSEQFYQALQGFFDLHQEYRGCDLYITGESYAGKYIPNIATWILSQNKSANDDQKINLKGLGIGDGWMYPERQTKLQIEYGFKMGFVDTLQKSQIDDLYSDYQTAIGRKDTTAAFNLGNCVSDTAVNCGGNPDIYDVRRWSDLPISNLKNYLDCKEVEDAIHAHPPWVFSDAGSEVANALMDDLETNVTGLFPDLIKAYRMLFYTGNFDMSCGFCGTEEILQNLNYGGEWTTLLRNVWTQEQPVFGKDLPATCGYAKGVDNLTQVVIPDSGHQVPVSQPAVSLDMLNNWIFKQAFCGFTPLIVKAKTKWQDTGITLSGGQSEFVKYLSGNWLASPVGGFVNSEGKKGLIAKEGYTLPGKNEGALCGRVGDSGVVFLIGKEAKIPDGSSGNLFLCINDDLTGEYGAEFADNEGSVTVAVITNIN